MGKGEKEAPKGLRLLANAQIEKDEALQALCDKKNVVLLAFVGSSMPRTGDPMSPERASISIVDEFGMEDALNQIQQGISKTKTKKAYLLINSLGGLERSSFKMAQAIRDTFDDITVFVPNIASSGGALLALTGDRIRMGMMSQLGPVDPQTSYLNHGSVSVNSILRARKRLDAKFENMQEREMGYLDRHMAEMLDEVVYEEFYGLRKASEAYLSTILRKAKYTQEQIDTISDILISDPPTHRFVIDQNRAEAIGLKVVSDGDAEEWGLMRTWFAKYAAEESDRHFIRYCIPKTKRVGN